MDRSGLSSKTAPATSGSFDSGLDVVVVVVVEALVGLETATVVELLLNAKKSGNSVTSEISLSVFEISLSYMTEMTSPSNLDSQHTPMRNSMRHSVLAVPLFCTHLWWNMQTPWAPLLDMHGLGFILNERTKRTTI